MKRGVIQLFCLLIAAQSASPQGDTTRATLRGYVVSPEGRPVQGAQVSLEAHQPITTDDQGKWVIKNVLPGRRNLDVRAIGFRSASRVVDAHVDTVAMEIVLSPVVPELEAVEVVAARERDHGFAGFERRRRSGHGRYITENDITRRVPVVTSDLFRSFPGIQRGSMITMRGAFGDCTPAVYIDEKLITSPRGLRPDDLDALVKPADILGIEIYYDAPPPQFQPGLSGCGSIVIWTR